MSPFDYGEDPNSVPAGTLNPSLTNSYKTLFAENGARHIIDGIRLGSTVDADTNGAPVTFGTIIAATDNDGVIFNATAGIPTLLNMQNNSTTANTVTVTASAAGFLNAWIDYNQNGLFDATEKIFADVPLVAGANTLTFNVTSATISGLTYARFRVTTGSGQATLPTGLAPNGEVEDYAVKLTSSVSNTSTCVANPPNTVGLNFRWFDTATSTSSFRRFQRVGALADGTLLDLELTSSLPVTVGGTNSASDRYSANDSSKRVLISSIPSNSLSLEPIPQSMFRLPTSSPMWMVKQELHRYDCRQSCSHRHRHQRTCRLESQPNL